MSNYWNTLSPIHSLLTSRESHAIGGSVGSIDRPKYIGQGYKKGGKAGGDDRWIQKVNKSIKTRGTKGKCTPITKKGCTGRAKALAKTFKKMAKKRKAA
tara:strand:+ start:1375 stop:1671 length:297 start_codon:yes stop_codon:yes gene_type:complete